MPSSFSATDAIPLSARWSEWDNRDRFVAGLTCPVLEKRRVCFSQGGISISPFLLVSVPKESTTSKEAVSLGVLTASMVSMPSVLNMAEEEVPIRRLLPARQSRVMLVASAFQNVCLLASPSSAAFSGGFPDQRALGRYLKLEPTQ